MRKRMTRHLVRAAAVLVAIVLLNGCGGDSPDAPTPNPPEPSNPVNPPNPPNPPTPPNPPNPGVQKYCRTGEDWSSVRVLGKDGGETVLFLETNLEPGDFTLSSSQPWCTLRVEATGVATRKNLVVKVEEYDPRTENGLYIYDPPRTATIRIVSGDLFDENVIIAQNCKVGFRTSLGDYPLKISAGGESKEVVVFTNCYSWTPRTEADWLTVQRKDNSTLIVTSKARPATQTTPREGIVYLVNDADKREPYWFTVVDADATLSGEDYPYGEHTDWE